jgi:hypothetical protein
VAVILLFVAAFTRGSRRSSSKKEIDIPPGDHDVELAIN